VLAAGARRAEGVDLQVGGIYFKSTSSHLRKDGDGDGAGVDAPGGLRAGTLGTRWTPLSYFKRSTRRRR
jgi:hypothetical protein